MIAKSPIQNIEMLQASFEEGKVPAGRIFDLLREQQQTVETLQQRFRRLQAEHERLRQRLAQYEPEVQNEREPSGETSPDSPSKYSLDDEEKRRRGKKRKQSRRRNNKKSPGRRPTDLKFAEAERLEDVYPEDVARADCKLLRERAVWRIEDGRGVLVGYRIFRGPGNRIGQIPGVTPRCEYGSEVLLVLAYQVYIIGISIDKACQLMAFFCQLPIGKSQADALLRQLAQYWEGEFDTLCDLITHAAVVYIDETSWKVGSESCSLWAFTSKLHHVFHYGRRRDAATLDQMLPPDEFEGTAVSDNAQIYRRYRFAQKCWAHLLRKAIRLAVLYPDHETYRKFLDELLQIFWTARRFACDKRLGSQGAARRVDALERRLTKLCEPYRQETHSAMSPHEKKFTKLVNELMDLLDRASLFTFVEDPEVEPTNNCSERNLRDSAIDRNCGRTNKTYRGSRRRSVIVSVLKSLQANLQNFTLADVLAEVTQWMQEGISLFTRQQKELELSAAHDTS